MLSSLRVLMAAAFMSLAACGNIAFAEGDGGTASTPAQAQVENLTIAPGEFVIAGAYCLTVEDMTELVAAVSVDGNEGYRRVMGERDGKCFDMNLHPNVGLVRVKLVKKEFSFTHADGTVFDIWSATAGGRIGYIWFSVEAQESSQSSGMERSSDMAPAGWRI